MNWETKLTANAPDEMIARKVAAAIHSLLFSDEYLLKVNASERSISHRLAQYMAAQFPDMDVDCEYNRDRHEIKRLHLLKPCSHSTDADGSPVYPDIIVHRRGLEENTLVIEIKKSTSTVSDDCDLQKLASFRDDLNYKAALFLRFQCDVANPTVSYSQWV